MIRSIFCNLNCIKLIKLPLPPRMANVICISTICTMTCMGRREHYSLQFTIFFFFNCNLLSSFIICIYEIYAVRFDKIEREKKVNISNCMQPNGFYLKCRTKVIFVPLTLFRTKFVKKMITNTVNGGHAEEKNALHLDSMELDAKHHT